GALVSRARAESHAVHLGESEAGGNRSGAPLGSGADLRRWLAHGFVGAWSGLVPAAGADAVVSCARYARGLPLRQRRRATSHHEPPCREARSGLRRAFSGARLSPEGFPFLDGHDLPRGNRCYFVWFGDLDPDLSHSVPRSPL